MAFAAPAFAAEPNKNSDQQKVQEVPKQQTPPPSAGDGGGGGKTPID
jgi:hypothetical protein